MAWQAQVDMAAISGCFRIEGRLVSAQPYGNGHINDTYAVVYENGGHRCRYIQQRINHDVFKDPESLMDNVRRVTEHQKQKNVDAAIPDADRRSLHLIPSVDGRSCHRDRDGNTWRTYVFVEGAATYEQIESAAQAFEAARAFAEFQLQLVDLPGARLHETIPDFHNTPKRFEALEAAITADPLNRAASVRAEIDFAMRRRDLADQLIRKQRKGLIPERVIHNDTKLNNVMLDNDTQRAVCVIDLDTVMPGLALYDFGDMVRTATSPAAEDERDLSKVHMQPAMFEALARGYLTAARHFLSDTEKDLLLLGGKLMTFECGIRFLADHLQGDRYFKIHRKGHNIDRCRTQFKLIESMEAQEDSINAVVHRLLAQG